MKASSKSRACWNSRRRLVVASIIGAVLPSGVMAQSASLEEVVVTAQKREESLQDAPIAITAFSNEQLQSIGAYDISDIGEYTPNVTLLGNAPASSSTVAVNIRGIRSQQPALATDSKIGIYIDGVYYARLSGALFDIAELERIEVLRGPQGTLWGRNTTGGAINVITAKPAGEFAFKQELSFGNYGYYRTFTSVDTPEVAGLSAKLTYYATGRDGTVDNEFPGTSADLGDNEADAYRLALRWQASDNLTADYAYDRYENEAMPSAFQLIAVRPELAESPTAFIPGVGIVDNPYAEAAAEVSRHRRSDVNQDFVAPEELTLEGHALTLSYQFENAEFKSITAYREYERVIDGTEMDGGAYSLPLFHATSDEQQEQFSQELQLVGDLSDYGIQYVVGLYYFEEQAEAVNPQVLTAALDRPPLPTGEPFLFPATSMQSYTTDNKSRAVYGQVGYSPSWSDSLTFTLGARYTEDEKQAELVSSGFEGKESWYDFSPSFTVEYMASDAVNLYGKVSSGYNSGIFNIRAGTQAAFGTPAEAEEVINYEAGIKSQWWNNRLRLNAAAFLLDYSELQVAQFQTSAAGAATVLTNAGEAEIRGVELELSAVPMPGLTIDFSWGYTDFEYREFITSIDQTTGIAIDEADSASPPGPEHTGSLSVQYEFGSWSFGRLTGRVGATYSDDMSAEAFADPVTDTEEHTLLNARLSLSDIPLAGGLLRASLWGKNLTDEEYLVRGIDFGLASGALGFAGATFSDPRTFGVDLSFVY